MPGVLPRARGRRLGRRAAARPGLRQRPARQMPRSLPPTCATAHRKRRSCLHARESGPARGGSRGLTAARSRPGARPRERRARPPPRRSGCCERGPGAGRSSEAHALPARARSSGGRPGGPAARRAHRPLRRRGSPIDWRRPAPPRPTAPARPWSARQRSRDRPPGSQTDRRLAVRDAQWRSWRPPMMLLRPPVLLTRVQRTPSERPASTGPRPPGSGCCRRPAQPVPGGRPACSPRRTHGDVREASRQSPRPAARWSRTASGRSDRARSTCARRQEVPGVGCWRRPRRPAAPQR